MIYSDKSLSQKLERTEARANADFVETRAAIEPESSATWIEVAGAYAMFDGVGSPLTQTFGLGVFEDATAEHLDELESFFKERGSEVFHEVSPMADQSLMAVLSDRGYRPIELTNVMYQELGEGRVKAGVNSEIKTRIIDDADADLWAETAAAGWATIHESLADFMLAFGKIAARTSGGRPFLAELEDRPIAAGGFQIYDDVCILAGASTIPEARRKGAQNALLAARLQFAIDNGCRFAMMCALPGSQSQTNAQKNGFNIAYTRTKWHLPV
jgi:GNAT superfamily N-acetyltransferase